MIVKVAMMGKLLKTVTLSVLVVLILSSTAHAGEWVRIFYSSDGGVFYARKSAFQKVGLGSASPIREGEFKLVPPQNPDFAYMLALYRVDCRQRTLMALSASLHARDGSMIESDGVDENTPPAPVEPGTGSEAVYHYLCGHY